MPVHKRTSFGWCVLLLLIGGVAAFAGVSDATRMSASIERQERAAAEATRRAMPLPQTQYEVPMVAALVRSTLQAARDDGGGALDFAM